MTKITVKNASSNIHISKLYQGQYAHYEYNNINHVVFRVANHLISLTTGDTWVSPMGFCTPIPKDSEIRIVT